MKECALCHVTQPVERFRVFGKCGGRERFCLDCKADRNWYAEKLRRQRWKGVDIDRVHYRLGAVRKPA